MKQNNPLKESNTDDVIRDNVLQILHLAVCIIDSNNYEIKAESADEITEYARKIMTTAGDAIPA